MNRKITFNLFYLIFMGLFFLLNKSYSQIEDFQFGATVRKMLVYAPLGIEPNSPLLLSLHGMNQDINYQQNQAKWELVAKEQGFVVVYPGGINNSWDLSGSSDIDFILAIIDEMYDRYKIDRNRVYLSGFSMGGMMTYYAANCIADKIAAFAPVSGYLMGGPNTNSSRPIPIIHTHGTTDDVVVFSGVQPCLDAWITRNNCPDTALVIQPYPTDKPSSNGTKYSWGPGTDSVEIVLLKIQGIGHWHSNNDNGVHTSKEIWNFCKKFSLGFGISYFKYAYVNDDNPKQIKVAFTLPIKQLDSLSGFSVKINNQVVEIDSVDITDSLNLTINLIDSILNSNEIMLSYNNGNVVSIFEKELVCFNDTLADNLLTGSSPRFISLSTTTDGDTLMARFNKKMLLPQNISSLDLNAEFNGAMNIPLLECIYYQGDSTILAFPLGEKIYADYSLQLSYSGVNIAASDSGMLQSFSDYPVTNKSKGLPANIISGTLENNAIAISLEFSKPMSIKEDQIGQIVIYVNGDSISIREIFTLKNSIRFVLPTNLYYGDTIKVSYIPGNITATDKGELQAFSDFLIINPLSMPTWHSIPGKIEAENYALQFGTDTETTGDTGGGLNVGWTESGDWLVYALENNTAETNYQISFRLAAQSSGASFNYFVGNEKIGQVSVPSTGGWQTWKSVVKDITIPEGKHYLKIVTTNGGYNINYFEVKKEFTSINNHDMVYVNIYPNPSSDYIIIKSRGFNYDRIEILDMTGKTIYNMPAIHEPVLKLPADLNNGIYLVRISNAESSHSCRIIILK
ncbi:MAG: carbohydrate-binding protein [Bacteroidales bacterium]|nr:carbohydrate-binding protein [Bacteroidales bacterium]